MDRDESKIQQKEQKENLDPYEINFLPEFEKGREPREAFVNQHGVTIGDHEYDSESNPLNHWSDEVDPSIMAGDEWVHPYKDVGFRTTENQEYFEKGITPQSVMFTHPDKDVTYGIGNHQDEEQEEAEDSK